MKRNINNLDQINCRHKDDEPFGSSTTLLEQQEYLQSLLGDSINEENWNKAIKFIGRQINGNGVVRKLKTERGVLCKQEDIARYFNEMFTQETHDIKKLQVPYTKQHKEVNTETNIALQHK